MNLRFLEFLVRRAERLKALLVIHAAMMLCGVVQMFHFGTTESEKLQWWSFYQLCYSLGDLLIFAYTIMRTEGLATLVPLAYAITVALHLYMEYLQLLNPPEYVLWVTSITGLSATAMLWFCLYYGGIAIGGDPE